MTSLYAGSGQGDLTAEYTKIAEKTHRRLSGLGVLCGKNMMNTSYPEFTLR